MKKNHAMARTLWVGISTILGMRADPDDVNKPKLISIGLGVCFSAGSKLDVSP